MRRFTDRLVVGMVLGLVAPVAGLLVFKQVNFPTTPLSTFLYDVFLNPAYRSMLSGVLTVSLVANALVFTVFIQTTQDRAAKGVFLSTALYGVGILILKFFF